MLFWLGFLVAVPLDAFLGRELGDQGPRPEEGRGGGQLVQLGPLPDGRPLSCTCCPGTRPCQHAALWASVGRAGRLATSYCAPRWVKSCGPFTRFVLPAAHGQGKEVARSQEGLEVHWLGFALQNGQNNPKRGARWVGDQLWVAQLEDSIEGFEPRGVTARSVCFPWTPSSTSGSPALPSAAATTPGCIVGRPCKECCLRVEPAFSAHEEEAVGTVLCGC